MNIDGEKEDIRLKFEIGNTKIKISDKYFSKKTREELNVVEKEISKTIFNIIKEQKTKESSSNFLQNTDEINKLIDF